VSRVSDHALDILRAVAEKAKTGHGLRAHALPSGTRNERQMAARWLRERGVPLYARRAGSDSAWFLIHPTQPEGFIAEWENRIIRDAYSEVVRAHQALSNSPHAATRRRSLTAAAISIGNLIGIDPRVALVDLTPEATPGSVQAILDDVDAVLGTP